MSVLTLRQAAANAFVLQRVTQIQKFCHKFGRNLPREEYRQEVYFQIIRRHHSLRLKDARDREMVISTWLGWQCKAARKTMLRHYSKHEEHTVSITRGLGYDEASPLDKLATTPIEAGHADRMMFSQEVRAVLRHADSDERIAVLCVLNDWSALELRDHLGMTIETRDQALRSLALKIKRIEDGKALGQSTRGRAAVSA